MNWYNKLILAQITQDQQLQEQARQQGLIPPAANPQAVNPQQAQPAAPAQPQGQQQKGVVRSQGTIQIDETVLQQIGTIFGVTNNQQLVPALAQAGLSYKDNILYIDNAKFANFWGDTKNREKANQIYNILSKIDPSWAADIQSFTKNVGQNIAGGTAKNVANWARNWYRAVQNLGTGRAF